MIAVLVVDDEPAHRLMVRRALGKARRDLAITEAGSLAEGTQAFMHGSFNLAIVDLNLAGESGLEFIRAARAGAANNTIPIIAISTSSLDTDVQAAYAAGANSFVFKTAAGRSFPADIAAAVAALLP